MLWGAAVGIQESTLRAVVADLVAPNRRASAYGPYAAVLGVATAGGGALTGYLYEHSNTTLVIVIVVVTVQVLALVFLAVTTSARTTVTVRARSPILLRLARFPSTVPDDRSVR